MSWAEDKAITDCKLSFQQCKNITNKWLYGINIP